MSHSESALFSATGMRRIAALSGGALLPLSFAPFLLWPAVLLGLGLVYWLIKDVTHWRRGFAIGWLVGVGKYGLGASWIYVSIHEQGGASESLAGVMVGLFVAGMALFSALFGALYGFANQRSEEDVPLPLSQALYPVCLFAAAWVVAEWCLTWLLTGFPWLFAGYGLMPTWLAGFAPVLGVLGLSFLACLLGGVAVVAGQRLKQGHGLGAVVGPAALLITIVLGGYLLTKVSWVALGSTHSVALVQGNIEQLTKWEPGNVRPILNTYENLSEDHWDAQLVIWPEAAITLFASQAQPLFARWGGRGKQTGTTLLLGVPDAEVLPDGSGEFQNTAVALGEGSGRYIKRRLVPFGEYVPLETLLRGLIEFFDLPMSRSGSGPEQQPPLLARDVRLGLAICYEIAYPELVRTSARSADVLVTISNDAWFGASIGPHQHLQIAQMRALENGRYVLRGTNNGVTAIIDERGRVTGALPQFQAAVLRGSYRTACLLYTSDAADE